MEPLLICGHQRSGTTLLASLLDGHEDLAVFPYETWLLLHASTGAFRGLTVREIVRRVLAHCHGWSAEPNFDYDRFVKLVETSIQTSGARIKTIGSVMELLSCCYAEVGNCASAKHWVEKSPMNELRLPVVKDEFPSLKAIYMMRDPRDVLLSWKRKREKETNGKETFTAEQIARNWTNSLAAWERYVAGYGGDGLLLRYEDLVQFPELTMQRVCQYLQIPFAESLLRPTQMGESWQGNSSHGNQHSVNAASVGKWRNELPPAESQRIDAYCGAATLRLGYHAQRFNTADVLRLFVRGESKVRLKLQLFKALCRLHYPYSSGDVNKHQRQAECAWYNLESIKNRPHDHSAPRKGSFLTGDSL
ncbi:MAG: sulfotransferase [Pyrinomonadaceae bacterium MAG19_C2-C3]|nr:sulfotransferase [Pyrinomonadaceae bacterium MAG19_C2-C3]